MPSSRALVRWGRVYEALAIVALSAGMNLLTGQADAELAGLRLGLGLLGGALITSGGVFLLFCSWQVVGLREAYRGDILQIEAHLDREGTEKRSLFLKRLAGLSTSIVGVLVYIARGFWA